MRVVSYHGFGGAFAYACRDLGLDLHAVVEPGGFGADMIEANRGQLGFNGPIHTKPPFPSYQDVDVVLGNPPCSGFSTMTVSPLRGRDYPANQCMWDLVRYAAGVNNGEGPRAVIWESVQGAGRQGRSLMRELRDELVRKTCNRWNLTHLFMSGASIGAAQVRKRYFWVATREDEAPIGIEPPVITRVVTYQDAIGDLAGLELQKDPQPCDSVPSWWSEPLRAYDSAIGGEGSYVRDHVIPETRWSRMLAVLDQDWEQGAGDRAAVRAYVARTGEPPPYWTPADMAWVDRDGPDKSMRIRSDGPGRVIAGDGGFGFFHWSEPRILTVRECARLMGFPDESNWGFTDPVKAYTLLGKQVPVHSWKWALGWLAQTLDGEPGWWQGDYDQEHDERVIDVTSDYKQIFSEKTRTHGVDSRSDAWKTEMRRRVIVGLEQMLGEAS